MVTDLQGAGTRPVFVDPNGVLTNGTGGATANSKQISFYAGSIIENPASSVITSGFRSLYWQHSFAETGYILIKKPNDWDQVTDVTFEIYFFSKDLTPSPGTVQFFMRPRDRDLGDPIIDEGAVLSTVANMTTNRVQEKVIITIPASRLQKEFWELAIQRESSNTTFTSDLEVQNVAMTYN